MAYLNAFAAEASSLLAVPSTLAGLARKSARIFHSPWPGVPPNAAGARSDMSNRNVCACASFVAVCRVIASGYALGGTFLFGDDTPPLEPQVLPASGLAMNL